MVRRAGKRAAADPVRAELRALTRALGKRKAKKKKRRRRRPMEQLTLELPGVPPPPSSPPPRRKKKRAKKRAARPARMPRALAAELDRLEAAADGGDGAVMSSTELADAELAASRELLLEVLTARSRQSASARIGTPFHSENNSGAAE